MRLPADAARDAEAIFTNVTSTADVEAVLLGPDGVIHGAPRGKPGGAVCIDHSTISAVATRRIAAELEAAGLDFLDAPVSGGTLGAQKATLSIMVGGKAEVLERARPCCSCWAPPSRTSAATARARSPRHATRSCR